MNKTTRIVLMGGALGAIVAGALAAPMVVPAVMASEPGKALLSLQQPLYPSPFDPNDFVKYDVTADASVSTEVSKTELVTKIGYGHKSIVRIVTTPTGVYSSDALGSPYVQYPGISVTPHASLEGVLSELGLAGSDHWIAVYDGSFVVLALGS